MKLYGPNPIRDADPPEWIARTTARGFDSVSEAIDALAALAPDGARPFRAVAMRQKGRGAAYDVKVIFERTPRPGDPPRHLPGSD